MTVLPANVRAVLFDAGSTLLRVEPSVGEVYASVAARYGVEASPEELDEAFRAEWEHRIDPAVDDTPFDDSEERQRMWWRTLVAKTFAPVGGPDAFDGRFPDYFDELYVLFAGPGPWHIYEDVAPALDALQAAGLAMAVVSNWDHRLPRLMKGLDMDRYFDFVLTSAEARCKKPFPRIFDEAIARLGIAPAQAVYVGDSLEHDVAGAQAAGLVPVHIARGKAPCDDGHVCIHALTDLPPLLGA